MYEVGTLIVYGSTGVCRVEEIVERKFDAASPPRSYLRLQPLYQSETIYTPVDNSRVFMRPVISRAEAERLVGLIPGIEAEAYHSRNVQDLAGYYQSFLQSHDCADLLELVMSIYAKKQHVAEQKKRFGQVDEHYMRRAQAMLYGELAVALGITLEEVPNYIAKCVEQSQ